MSKTSSPFVFLKNPKVQVILLLFALCLFAVFKGNIEPLPAVPMILLAVLTAVFAELAVFGKVSASSIQSSIISGLIVGTLIAPGTDMKIVWFASVAAIASKKLFQAENAKHIFNPAAFGLAVMLPLFGSRINWWGFSSPYIVIAAGGFILYRMNRLSMVFSYILFRMLGAIVTGAAGFGLEALELPNLFFAFIMLIEPKTSPSPRTHQWIFGGLVGILSAASAHLLPSAEGDLLALLAMNFLRACRGR